MGEGIFDRLLSREAGLGWEAARLCVSKEAKLAKIVSLIARQLADCARLLKDVSIFAGSAPVRAQIVARKRFELRSVIATTSFLI